MQDCDGPGHLPRFGYQKGALRPRETGFWTLGFPAPGWLSANRSLAGQLTTWGDKLQVSRALLSPQDSQEFFPVIRVRVGFSQVVLDAVPFVPLVHA